MDIRILIRTKNLRFQKTGYRDNPYYCTKIFRFVLLRVKRTLSCDQFSVRFTESKEADLSCGQLRHRVLRCLC
jgi:hypothetical protein